MPNAIPGRRNFSLASGGSDDGVFFASAQPALGIIPFRIAHAAPRVVLFEGHLLENRLHRWVDAAAAVVLGSRRRSHTHTHIRPQGEEEVVHRLPNLRLRAATTCGFTTTEEKQATEIRSLFIILRRVALIKCAFFILGCIGFGYSCQLVLPFGINSTDRFPVDRLECIYHSSPRVDLFLFLFYLRCCLLNKSRLIKFANIERAKVST